MNLSKISNHLSANVTAAEQRRRYSRTSSIKLTSVLNAAPPLILTPVLTRQGGQTTRPVKTTSFLTMPFSGYLRSHPNSAFHQVVGLYKCRSCFRSPSLGIISFGQAYKPKPPRSHGVAFLRRLPEYAVLFTGMNGIPRATTDMGYLSTRFGPLNPLSPQGERRFSVELSE